MQHSEDDEKRFLMQHPSILHTEILTLGNGNFDQGWHILGAIASKLKYVSREKHKWGKGHETTSPKEALAALNSEIGEWTIANREYELFAYREYEQRVFDEAMDIIAVAIRIANREFER